MTEQHDETLDPRTESDRKVDDVLGAGGLTQLDKQFGRILKHAERPLHQRQEDP